MEDIVNRTLEPCKKGARRREHAAQRDPQVVLVGRLDPIDGQRLSDFFGKELTRA